MREKRENILEERGHCKKGVLTVHYIVVIILGISVIVVMTYWFLSTSGKTGVLGPQTQCDAKYRTYCKSWSLIEWQAPPAPPDWGICDRLSSLADDELRKYECAEILGEEIPT